TMSASAGKALLLDSIDVSRKPRDDEIDVYGVTHKGNVRVENQDHFLLSSIYKHVEILSTSLSDLQRRPLGDERVAFLAMVADGVGGGEGGEEANATARCSPARERKASKAPWRRRSRCGSACGRGTTCSRSATRGTISGETVC